MALRLVRSCPYFHPRKPVALPELTALPLTTLPPPPYRPRVARWLTFAGISLIVGSFVFPAIAMVALGIDKYSSRTISG